MARLHHRAPPHLDLDRRHRGTLREHGLVKRPRDIVWSRSIDRSAPTLRDYEADDVLVVSRPEQLRALADEVRPQIVLHLRERAQSTTELADRLGLARGTVAYHLKILERAGLVRVVRTRRVRALTERLYGRTARLFVLRGDEAPPGEAPGAAVAAAALRRAAEEVASPRSSDRCAAVTYLPVRLGEADASRFVRRLERLLRDFSRADDPAGELYVFAGGIYPRELP